jgi:prepilin-type processing-associated H-X9-DG protein
LYNAANFSFACCSDSSRADAINFTVTRTRIASFLCPSDGNAGVANINSYYANLGPTPIWYNPPNGDMSGPFTVYGPSPYRTSSYGLADITDGTSNTIAFGEGLVGDGKNQTSRSNGMTNGMTAPAGLHSLYNAAQNPTLVTQALQACNSFWKGTAILGNPGNPNKAGLKNYLGQYWAQGERGYTLFHTLVPPNSTIYPWRLCGFTCLNCAPEGSEFVNANSNHPGGANFAFVDGSVKFIKSSIADRTYWAIGSRSGGETVSADSY